MERQLLASPIAMGDGQDALCDGRGTGRRLPWERVGTPFGMGADACPLLSVVAAPFSIAGLSVHLWTAMPRPGCLAETPPGRHTGNEVAPPHTRGPGAPPWNPGRVPP